MRATQIVLVLSVLAVGSPLHASTFVVNDPVGTFGDALPGDGVCETVPGSGSCTWAAALEEANARLGADGIVLPAGTFAVPPPITDPVVIAGAGADVTIIDAQGQSTVIQLDEADVTLVGVTIQGGNGTNVGGGIRNYRRRLALVDCVVRYNQTGNVGGGIYSEGGTLTLIRTTVHDNFAFNVGGGVYSDGHATLVNSTISNNRVLNVGGGIANEGQMSLSHCTVTLNGAINTAAGLYSAEGAQTTTVGNTLLGGNILLTLNPITFELIPIGPGGDCVGVVTAVGANLIQNPAPNCSVVGPAPLTGADPLLLALADNGGSTPTHALATGSPAIDAADAATCASIDQRGIPRPQGAGCDLGAFEYSLCGNGALDAGEACDDGNAADGDGCDSNCTPTGCGNGITTAGEECDDGNTADGDCCSATCTLTVDEGGTASATIGGSAVEVAEMAGGKFSWKWTGTAPAVVEDFGTPETSTEYTLCVLDLSAGASTLVFSTSVPVGAGWARSATRLQYKDLLAGPGRISRLALKAGFAGKIALKGRGGHLRQGRLPLVTPVRVVLKRTDAPSAWGATFSSAKQNRLERFKAKSD